MNETKSFYVLQHPGSGRFVSRFGTDGEAITCATKATSPNALRFDSLSDLVATLREQPFNPDGVLGSARRVFGSLGLRVFKVTTETTTRTETKEVL